MGSGVDGEHKPWAFLSERSLIGLAVTLAAITVFSLYALRQIASLKEFQASTVDRNRKDSLQLLRIQNDLHSLGLAMRDMLSGEEPYPLHAWQTQFGRIHNDLDDALKLESALAPALRNPGQQEHLHSLLNQFWESADRAFDYSRQGQVQPAKAMVRDSLDAQLASLTTTVARLMAGNNEVEEQAVIQVRGVYDQVERRLYFFLAATLITISLTSLYLIQSNRRMFGRLTALSAARSALARKLITAQEEVLHSISRELHDEFGQILTAIGVMLGRAEKRGVPPGSAELREVREVAQEALEKMRSLSQGLHPSILDDGGLEKAIDWYIPVFEKQTGIQVQYEKQSTNPAIPERVGVNVYRVLQESLNNVARHARTKKAWVRAKLLPDAVSLEVEDHGVGIPERGAGTTRGGIGTVAMRERANLLQGTLEFLRPAEGGTLVRLRVPLNGMETDGN